jgi:hypothetical protein
VVANTLAQRKQTMYLVAGFAGLAFVSAANRQQPHRPPPDTIVACVNCGALDNPAETGIRHCHLLRGGADLSKPTDLVQGTLDLLILKVPALEPMDGWAIAQRIRQMSGEILQVGQSAFYSSLHNSNRTAGSVRNGPSARTTGEPNTTRRPKSAAKHLRPRRNSGNVCPAPSP